LWQTANEVLQRYGGTLPNTINALVTLPGIGHNTAGAILAYAYNQPSLFVETNVRSVYFHHFFTDKTDIADSQVLDLLGQTIDTNNPREFYWALMDYGSYLKQQRVGSIRSSKHYSRQSTFQGSARQIRGAVIRQLTKETTEYTALLELLADTRAPLVIEQLEKEALIKRTGSTYHLA
jgi:A/G-specific adenine glycosylase